MTNFILIFLCISTGIFLSRRQILPKDSYKAINAWILNIALPALALRYVPGIDWSTKILLPLISPLLIWIGAWAFVQIYDWKKKLSTGTRTALLVTSGLGNTAFLGYPMISAFYGESEIRHAVVFDQVTFLLFSTLAVIVVLRNSSDKSPSAGFMYILRKVFSFPPLIGCLVALILPHFMDISFANDLLDKLVATISPMALFSVGLQIRFGTIKQEWKVLCAGLTYKLLLAPLLVLLLAFCLHTTGNPGKIAVFEASMSPHITVSLMATQYNHNPKLCSLMVGVGILASFATSTLWYIITSFYL